jgi:hypothetical protein
VDNELQQVACLPWARMTNISGLPYSGGRRGSFSALVVLMGPVIPAAANSDGLGVKAIAATRHRLHLPLTVTYNSLGIS